MTVGKVRAGDAFNVIPDSAELIGTVRTFDHAVKERIRVWCGTWNMHAAAAGRRFEAAALTEWIEVGSHDVFAIATQEAERSIARSLVWSSKPRLREVTRHRHHACLVADGLRLRCCYSCGEHSRL